MLNLLNSSIGRKLINGITGILLMIFVVFHLMGNLLLVFGTPLSFNRYSHFLSNLGVFIIAAELALFVVFIVHIITGIAVWIKGKKAKGENLPKININDIPGNYSLASRTMILSGALLLAFLISHIVTFKYGPGIENGYMVIIDGRPMRDMYRLTVEIFSNPLNVGFYVGMMVVLGFHLRQGFWSAFQSIGINNPKSSGFLWAVGLVFAIILAFGFAIIPLWIFLIGGR